MSHLDYKDAQKQGMKEFRACTARGQYPYLLALGDFVAQERMNQGVDLGTIQIPMEFIVGGRSKVFARNFMPLVEENSEFADKWKALCQAHLEEGIRDPVKVYEYLNRFYVEEGNKRVSVLKYFGAPTVYAHVIRVLPERNGSEEIERYYEFVDFYRYSKVNFLEFSKPGSYTQLQRLLGKAPDEAWTDEDRTSLSTTYYHFRQAYEAKGGRKLTSTAGDAMLAYFRVYGYQSLRGRSASEIKQSVSKVWEEIALQQEIPAIDVKLDPASGAGEKSFLTKVIPAKVIPKLDPKKIIKAAFVHDKTPETSGWTYGHELGRRHLEHVFNGELETAAYFNAMEGEPLDVIEGAITDGNTVIFTTSPRLLPASLRSAVEHPEVIILNCSLNQSHRYIRTYYARMYEVKFVSGAIAGAMAGSDNVGYICDYPIFGQLAGINAFALGVQMTAPTAKVYLEWSAVGGIKAAAKRLTDRGIRLISSQDQAKRENWDKSPFGLSLVTGDEQVNLAMSVWQWGVYYEAVLRSIKSKTFQSEYLESSKALNYYWGMSAGVVDLSCSDKLPDSVRKLAAVLKRGIRAGVCVPFRGPLHAQGGRQIAQEGDVLTSEQIINMHWLYENIVGSLPAYDELDDTGKATVGIVGVDPSAQDKDKR